MSMLNASSSDTNRSAPNASITSVTLLAINAARKGYVLYNNGTGTIYVAHGSKAGSSLDFTYQLAPGSFYESAVDFTGLVTGVWSVVGGNANVTEYI